MSTIEYSLQSSGTFEAIINHRILVIDHFSRDRPKVGQLIYLWSIFSNKTSLNTLLQKLTAGCRKESGEYPKLHRMRISTGSCHVKEWNSCVDVLPAGPLLPPLPPRHRRRERCRCEHRHGPIVQHTEGKAIPQCMSREDEKLSGGFSCSCSVNEARYWSCAWLYEDFICSMFIKWINRKVLAEAFEKKNWLDQTFQPCCYTTLYKPLCRFFASRFKDSRLFPRSTNNACAAIQWSLELRLCEKDEGKKF